MEMFLVFVGNGVVIGSIYAMLAMGLSFTFSIMRLVNFAHGEIYVLGSYMAWVVITKFVANFWLGLLLAIVVGAVLGYIIERFAYRTVYQAGYLSQFLVSLGVVVILQEAMRVGFSGLTQTCPTLFPTVRVIGKFAVTDQRLIVVGMTILIVAGIFLFFNRTKMGKAMRATRGSPLAAGMVGISVPRMRSVAFMGCAALATVAGALLAPIFSFQPFIGMRYTVVAIIVIVAGGIGSIGGAAIAGYALGIIESLFAGYLLGQWTFSVGFFILIVVLKFRPQGLFGKERA